MSTTDNSLLPISGGDRAQTRRERRGFTLIELLVVIAIIGVLAALIVGATTVASKNKVENRVKAELNALVGAIESFHKKNGFYPADNGDVVNTGTNQLFYELTGTLYDKSSSTFTDFLGGTLTTPEITSVFKVSGFVNSEEKDSEAKKVNFLPNLKPSGYAEIPGKSPTVRVLVVPSKGRAGSFNTWHYNSHKPDNNTETFDLWAELEIGGKFVIIGNWKE
jgi:prepilin-type N-terminal cleavage/methylation domain-containing protein